MLENECGNYKGLNYKENISIIYGGGDPYKSDSCSIYFIDKKKVTILNKIDFNYVIKGLYCKNNILYASLVKFTNFLKKKIKKYKIDNDNNQIYEVEKFYSWKGQSEYQNIYDVIDINSKIIVLDEEHNDEFRLIRLDI